MFRYKSDVKCLAKCIILLKNLLNATEITKSVISFQNKKQILFKMPENPSNPLNPIVYLDIRIGIEDGE